MKTTMNVKIKVNQAPWETRVLRKLKEELWDVPAGEQAVVQATHLKKPLERRK